MSAQFKALTIQSGITRRILDADSLEVGAGINISIGDMAVIPA